MNGCSLVLIMLISLEPQIKRVINTFSVTNLSLFLDETIKGTRILPSLACRRAIMFHCAGL